MNWQVLTTWMGLGLLVVAVGYDALAAFANRVPNSRDTFSGLIQLAGVIRGVWGIAYALGFLVGHFVLFRNVGSILGNPGVGFLAAAVLAACVTVLGAWWRSDGRKPSVWIQLALVQLGLLSGHLLWPLGGVT